MVSEYCTTGAYIGEMGIQQDLCLPGVSWGNQFSARPEHQSVSMTTGYQAHSQRDYVGYHMPGEGSIERGNRTGPESSSSLQVQQNQNIKRVPWRDPVSKLFGRVLDCPNDVINLTSNYFLFFLTKDNSAILKCWLYIKCYIMTTMLRVTIQVNLAVLPFCRIAGE